MLIVSLIVNAILKNVHLHGYIHKLIAPPIPRVMFADIMEHPVITCIVCYIGLPVRASLQVHRTRLGKLVYKT